MAKRHTPGEKVPASGLYKVVGPRGGKTDEERTCVEDERFPPTPEKGQKYVLTRATKH